MIYDKLTTFASAESVAAGAGTALIGDVIDLGAAGYDLGLSGPNTPYLVLTCTTSIITGGAAGTIQFKLASDAAAAIATDGSASEHLITPAYVTDDDALNDLDAGNTPFFVAKLPMAGVTPYERYLGILATIATTTVTAGAITGFLTLDPPQSLKLYADAVD